MMSSLECTVNTNSAPKAGSHSPWKWSITILSLWNKRKPSQICALWLRCSVEERSKRQKFSPDAGAHEPKVLDVNVRNTHRPDFLLLLVGEEFSEFSARRVVPDQVRILRVAVQNLQNLNAEQIALEQLTWDVVFFFHVKKGLEHSYCLRKVRTCTNVCVFTC